MEIQRICRKCGEVNLINSDNLVRASVHDEEGNFYRLMYYDCKRCKERIPVQIDDKETTELYNKIKTLTIKVIRKHQKGETVSPKDIRKKDRLTKQLRESREILSELCSGKKLFDENEKIVVEQLTFPKVGDIIESKL